MEKISFDQLVDYAATHTSVLSGNELIRSYRNLLIRYDEIREREHIASFIHTLLNDLCFYEKHPDTEWTEEAIFDYLEKYEI